MQYYAVLSKMGISQTGFIFYSRLGDIIKKRKDENFYIISEKFRSWTWIYHICM